MLLQDSIVFYISVIFLIATLRMTFLHAQITSKEIGRNTNRSSHSMNTNTTYEWSSWGAWSACSKSCGGGVAIQERQCLPKDPTRWHRSRRRRKLVSTSMERHRRRSRETHPPTGDSCPGLTRRYHECNTAPCPGPPKDPRSEQCAAYDRRPFRGRFYTWVPYIDGDAPCTLNCRPRGQQFYATLALVADGTPCTKPGFRAICVLGACKVVGREGVLSSATSREIRCGGRLVSGLFTKPNLPLGYSHVATVPRGACRLNISEIFPTPNYIALKLYNGSYILNGEFAVSSAGSYDAAGARFLYTRSNDQDIVYSHGPILEPIEIMVLYTQSNPSIKYEYLTDSRSEDTNNEIPTANNKDYTPHHQSRHHHRHLNTESHTKSLETAGSDPTLSKQPELSNSLDDQSQIESNIIGDKKFVWKILSFSQCTRSCGGGTQFGKYECVRLEGKEERAVAAVHCAGVPPSARRRRCGVAACPPRWRASPWGPCPVCGPAHRTRNVGCVQDHSKGIIKISNQKCPLPMPPNSELCNIPNCDGSAHAQAPRPDTRRQVRPRTRTETFKDNPVLQVAPNSSTNDISSYGFTTPAYSFSAAGGWLYTEWSECVGWCFSGGVQSRGVRCADPSGCSSYRVPETSQSCTPRITCEKDDGQWFTSDWSQCSAACSGRQVRGVLCIGGKGRRLRESACKSPRPEQERECGGACAPSWYLSDWGECEGPCESGIQARTVWCARGGAGGAGGAARDGACAGPRPAARRACVPARCSTRPALRPQPLHPPPTVTDNQRVTRHQNRNIEAGQCMDRLSNCVLVVQGRMCHYAYYSENCCRSCHGR